MILVDTSIWVAHARTVNETLSDLLAREAVLGHPFVIGELALGGFKPATLRILGELPSALLATNDEVLTLILDENLAGRGVGYADAHLVASARLTSEARLWTIDKKLKSVAEDLRLFADFAS